MNYQIIRDMPLPPKSREFFELAEPLQKLGVKDVAVLPKGSFRPSCVTLYKTAKRLGIRVATRKMPNGSLMVRRNA